jgi:hypothetical protein
MKIEKSQEMSSSAKMLSGKRNNSFYNKNPSGISTYQVIFTSASWGIFEIITLV